MTIERHGVDPVMGPRIPGAWWHGGYSASARVTVRVRDKPSPHVLYYGVPMGLITPAVTHVK